MKELILLTLAIVVTIQIGFFLTENVRIYTAGKLNYEGEFKAHRGLSFFINQEMQNEFRFVREKFNNEAEIYINSSDWKSLSLKDTKDHALIGLSGKLFTFLISIIGLSIFFFRRNRSKTMNWKDWSALLLGFFFMRNIFIDSFYLARGSILCDEAKLWRQLNLPSFGAVIIFTLIGWILLFYIIRFIPKPFNWRFLISGIIGSFIGILIWIFFTGNLLNY